MIKIYIPNISKQSIGGGWTFIRNFIKAITQPQKLSTNKEKYYDQQCQIVNNWQDCDIYLIISITVIDKNELHAAHDAGKRIILRIDNIPKKSRNRRMSPAQRIKEFAKISSAVVYQSEWAKEYAEILGGDGEVIYNGVDVDIFTNLGEKINTLAKTQYLYVQFNNDENKRMTEAFYNFQKQWRVNKEKVGLYIVGKFHPDLINGQFDFFNNENIQYLGVIENQNELAKIYRASDYILFPAYLDACPNTLIEALSCGCVPKLINTEGGSQEIMDLFYNGFDFSLRRMIKEYINLFNKIL